MLLTCLVWKVYLNKKRVHYYSYKSISSVHFFLKKRAELDVAESLLGGGKKPARISARWDWQRKKKSLLFIYCLTSQFWHKILKFLFVESSFHFSFRAVWILNTCTSVIFFFFLLLLLSTLGIWDWYQEKFPSFYCSLSWAFLFLTKLVKCPCKK